MSCLGMYDRERGITKRKYGLEASIFTLCYVLFHQAAWKRSISKRKERQALGKREKIKADMEGGYTCESNAKENDSKQLHEKRSLPLKHTSQSSHSDFNYRVTPEALMLHLIRHPPPSDFFRFNLQFLDSPQCITEPIVDTKCN